MTIDETKDELYRLLSDCVNNSYPIRNNTQKGRYRNAVKMAIASLEAWERVKDDIHEYETDCLVSADCADCKDCNMVMFKSIYQIIDKHLQEVEA